MVCLHGATLTRLKEGLNLQQINEYPLWNWVVHKLTAFMCRKYGVFSGGGDGGGKGAGVPYIPSEWEDNAYSIWFWAVYAYFETRFNDVTTQRLMCCLQNVPEEEMANMIYDLVPLAVQVAFHDCLPIQESEVVNPVDNEVDGGAYADLPDLIPVE